MPRTCGNGNATSKSGGSVSNLLTWDAENKQARVSFKVPLTLAAVTVGGLTYSHTYDANHARVLKVVPASGASPERATTYLGGEVEIDDLGT